MSNEIQSESLQVQYSKRKNFLILFGILAFIGILSGMFLNFYSSNKESFQNRKKAETKKEAETQTTLLDKGEYNEGWAISVENDIDNLKEIVAQGIDANEKSFRTELAKNNDTLSAAIQDMKSFVELNQKASDEKMNKMSDSINLISKTTDEKLSRTTSELKRSINAQQTQVQSLGQNSNGLPELVSQNGNRNNNSNLALPSDPSSLPGLGNNDNSTFSANQNSKNMNYNNSSTGGMVKKAFISELTNEAIKKKAEEKVATKKEPAPIKSYEIATGFTDALMITGAYAPLFGASNEESSIPVLLKATGDIIIANDNTESIDNCFILGGAVGNPSSNTVDIRLSKLECVLADGKTKIRGDVKGWVIGEDGKPGVKGELIHKSGEYISRFIVAGFLETFSTALVNSAAPKNGTNGTTTSILTGGATQGAATGVQNAFTKLSEFYIKLAEKTLPMIEAKGGRKVSILLNGGNVYKVEKFNKLNINNLLDDYIDSKKQGK